jgi:N-dimethylarginine dimethylaminohydrolase
MPADWGPHESSLGDDLESYWGGPWGCDSECGRLGAVLLRRPGAEIEGIEDPAAFRFKASMDPARARAQHDALADVYRSCGAVVHYVEHMRDDRPNALFMRDNVLGTPQGAIVGRQAMECRRGEERYAAEALARLGVPILRTVSGDGIFETACCLWVDATTVLIGLGDRANDEGYRQVRQTLSDLGVETFLELPVPEGYAHIDSIITLVRADLAAIDARYVPDHVVAALTERGITVVAAPDDAEFDELALNVVALGPGHVVMAAGNPNTRAFLERLDVRVEDIDVSEILKGWGSIHCMTAVLRRASIGESGEPG